MQAIGTGIGNSAAHELGHQYSDPALPYMDCGYDTQRQGDPIACENNNNFVYNFFSGSGFPQDPNNSNSTGAQFKYTGVPSITWGPSTACALKRKLLGNPIAPCN